MVCSLITLFLVLLHGIGIAEESPPSMETFIQAELAPFAAITQEQLDATEQLLRRTNCPLMRVKIAGGNFSYNVPPEGLYPYHPARIDGFVRLFQKLAPDLPDLELIIFLDDGFYQAVLSEDHAPIFCIAKQTTQDRVLCIPEIHAYPTADDSYTQIEEAGAQLPWEERAGLAFWRGATTGAGYFPENWMDLPRTRLVVFSKSAPEQFDCAFYLFCQGSRAVEAIMRSQGLFGERYNPISQLKYKYLIAIDGNSFPSSLKWQLFSGSVILKNESDWLEWFSYALVPFEHYVPYKLDFSDLLERMMWLKENDSLAHEIARNAKQFGKSHLTSTSIEGYVHKLLVAYSKLQKSG